MTSFSSVTSLPFEVRTATYMGLRSGVYVWGCDVTAPQPYGCIRMLAVQILRYTDRARLSHVAVDAAVNI